MCRFREFESEPVLRVQVVGEIPEGIRCPYLRFETLKATHSPPLLPPSVEENRRRKHSADSRAYGSSAPIIGERDPWFVCRRER